MSKRIILMIGVAVAVVVLLLILVPRCQQIDTYGSLWHSLFHISIPVPDPNHPGNGKPDIVHVDTPKPPFQVGEVSVNHGEATILTPIGDDSLTFQQIHIPTTGSGAIHVYIDPNTGQLVIDRDRFGIDLALIAGPSIHGISGGLETFFVNDFLGMADMHLVLPAAEVSVWNADRGDIYVGVGASAELWPRHTSIRLQGAYEWMVEDLQQSRITVGLNVPLLF